jgi:polyphosphate kinase 2 (PPK2 family)
MAGAALHREEGRAPFARQSVKRISKEKSKSASQDVSATADNRAVESDYRAVRRSLKVELVKLQKHFIRWDDKILVVIEDRDAAGKDGVIERIVQKLVQRERRLVVLGKPSDRERGSWYLQALRPAPAGRAGIRLLQPELVQPFRRRACDGLLRRGGV